MTAGLHNTWSSPESLFQRGRAPMVASFVLLFISSPAFAISTRTLIAPTGAAAHDGFGYSVASAGDVNGDGYADVIVGAPTNDAGGSNAGRAYVFYGGPGSDASADLTLTGAEADALFGASVASAGDVNGDGYGDVIVGEPNHDTGTGRAFIYYGGTTANATADLTLTGTAVLTEFGFSVAAAGDVNGDGYGDVIVGAAFDDPAGHAYVYYGGPGPDAIADLTLAGEVAFDQFGDQVGTAGDVNGDGYADLIVGAYVSDAGGPQAGRAYVYHGGPAVDATADLTLTGAAAGDFFGSSVGTAGDVNGDGYADLIVGAVGSDAGGADAGRAYVYYGGPGADATADLILTGEAADDVFGHTSGTAGDVNGDGYADLIVGARCNDAGGSAAGRAYVYFGGPAADVTADVTLTGAAPGDSLGISVATAGDVNGDGYADVIVGAYRHDQGATNAGKVYVTSLYSYQLLAPNGGEQWVAGQPASVRWLGHDVADLTISFDAGVTWSTLAAGIGGLEENEFNVIVPSAATSFAKVRLSYSGEAVTHATSDASDGVFSIVLPRRAPAAAHRLDLTLTGEAAGDFFGVSARTAGDVNGDGYADVIVGAPSNGAGGAGAGRAYVFHGGAGRNATADLTLTGAAALDAFGTSVGSAGDVNGDGYGDLIVGAVYSDAGGAEAGRAYVYYGGPGADATADITLTGAAAGDNFGVAVGSAGDVNGDGYGDLIVGAVYNDAGGADAGRAYIYYGGPAADATADLTLTGAAAGDVFGNSVGTAGDVNGDGYADVIVGALQNDAGGAEAGRAYVYYGGPGADAIADLTLTGAAAGDNFGRSVAGAGDVNGDGYADVIVGAQFNNAGGLDAGRAYVYFGGPAADATADMTLTGAAAGDTFGNSVGTAGDVNGDGFADLIVAAAGNDAGGEDAGRAYVYYGGPAPDAVADHTLTGAATNDHFGTSVGTAGDVNGDGFADLIVGASTNDAGGADAGRAYVYDCNRYFVLTPNGGETWNVGAAQTVSWLGAEPADVWLSVDGGAIWQLLESGVGGAASNAVAERVPHTPTRFARVKVTPSEAGIGGSDKSDSLYTIQSSVALLNFVATPTERGTELAWSTEPGVRPDGLLGYRLYRLAAGASGSGTRIGPELIVENRYRDEDVTPGSTYRLVAVNGLLAEVEVGRATVAAVAALAAWPLPYRGGELNVSFAIYGRLGAASGVAEVALYDVTGRRVKTLARGSFAGVAQQVRWDGRDEAGRAVEDGLYFLVSRSGSEQSRLKVVVMR